jgi:hypothetical protein
MQDLYEIKPCLYRHEKAKMCGTLRCNLTKRIAMQQEKNRPHAKRRSSLGNQRRQRLSAAGTNSPWL